MNCVLGDCDANRLKAVSQTVLPHHVIKQINIYKGIAMKIQVPLSPWEVDGSPVEEEENAAGNEFPTPKNFCGFTPFRHGIDSSVKTQSIKMSAAKRTPLADLGGNVTPSTFDCARAKVCLSAPPPEEKPEAGVQLIINISDSEERVVRETAILRERVHALEAELLAKAHSYIQSAPVTLSIQVAETIIDDSLEIKVAELEGQRRALEAGKEQLLMEVAQLTGALAQQQEEMKQLRAQLERSRQAEARLAAKVARLEAVGQERADEQASTMEFLCLERHAESEEREEVQRHLRRAEGTAAEWKAEAQRLKKDRDIAAENVAKAEREFDLLAEENTALFRQIQYVKMRLAGSVDVLDHAVPAVGRLARDLATWCESKEGPGQTGLGAATKTGMRTPRHEPFHSRS